MMPGLAGSDAAVRRLALRFVHGLVRVRTELMAEDLGVSGATPDLRWVVRLGDVCLRGLTMACTHDGREVRCR